ncbi:uncharacterized protein KD926_008897 [Aspergillus affinis]|uniref:uncharacterized protein n=1 Tax=Aspergillus affinis TaxID=1070780 RepID=UPI0022FF15CA|nr:uncharacterized protein KD926_008897 [Aspergillus affinis]KAI9039912.1 hypothetical protein KD926_008897 [Aspergillus affinis]
MASSLRPQFFCTRPNGTLTPLIAVDELPPHVSIRGAPRTLSPNETQGMTSLGTLSPRAQSYVVEGVSQVPTRATSANANGHRSRDYDMHTALARLTVDENMTANQRLAVSNMLQQGSPQSWSANNNWLVPSGSGGSGGGSSRQSNPLTKKEFCSYWIRHGECDYQQQGCLYKHEMPRDLPTLEKLGLRDIPRWFREKYNIPSLVPSGHGHPRAQGGHGQHWKDDMPGRAGMKSIQYLPRLDPNGAIDTSDAEKGPKQKSPGYAASQQSPAMAPGPSRSAFPAGNSPKAPDHQRQAGKYGPQFGPAAKMPDIFAFDHLPEYPSLSAMGSGIGALNHPTARDDVEALDRAEHEEFFRNMALMPNAELLRNPFDMSSGTNRSRKAQKSRRLYQPRPQTAGHEARYDTPDHDTYKSVNSPVGAGPSLGPSISKDGISSPFASPLASPIAETPTRDDSPSAHSGSSHASEVSPRVIQPQGSDKDRPMPSPIGSKRAQQKKPMGSSNDFFKLNSKGHEK